MNKLDLHTHSYVSPDGNLQLEDYQAMFEAGGLNYIAVTDHNRVDGALELQKQLGDRVIVGEEIATRDGEVIGLYLRELVPAQLSATETIKRIRQQGGLVYIPHPFEHWRHGLGAELLDTLVKDIDIVESCNGRTLRSVHNDQAKAWADLHRLPSAASSDAHGRSGWGRTYSLVDEIPTCQNLPRLLAKGSSITAYPGIIAHLHPSINRWQKRFRHA